MTQKKIIKIVEDFTNKKAINIHRIMGNGQVNDIYYLSTTQAKYIVRIDPNESTINRFQKEAWCMTEANKLQIPVPEVFEVGIIEEHPYMLISHIDGLNGNTATDTKIVWSKLGDYASKIHSITAQGYGEDMTSPGIFNDSWLRFLDYNITSLNSEDKLLQLGAITEKQSTEIKKIFIILRETKFNFGLIHDDLSLKNTIVGNDGIYLLDWGSAQVSVVPHLDIAEILDSSLDENSDEFKLFLKAYGLQYSEYKNIETQINHLNTLVYTDKLRWALDRRPDKTDHFIHELKKRLAKLSM